MRSTDPVWRSAPWPCEDWRNVPIEQLLGPWRGIEHQRCGRKAIVERGHLQCLKVGQSYDRLIALELALLAVASVDSCMLRPDAAMHRVAWRFLA